MKLEAINLLSPENIHVATVTRVKGQYVWLSLEGEKREERHISRCNDTQVNALHVKYVDLLLDP